MSDITQEQCIIAALEELRPAIQMDGGDIQFVQYKDNIVYIRFKGACVGCPMSIYTLKMGIEQLLKDRIPDIIEVCSVDDTETID